MPLVIIDGDKATIIGEPAGPEILAEIGHRIGPDECAVVISPELVHAALGVSRTKVAAPEE